MKNLLLFSTLLLLNFCVLGQEEDDDVDILEKNALIDLYNATDGPNWKNNTNWDSDKPVSTWFGVIVDTSLHPYHVKELELFENNLIGEITYSIEDLTELTVLSLNKNGLTGDTFDNICKLKKLEYLDLGENPTLFQEGYIYLDNIGELTNLEYISFNKNYIGIEIPSNFSNLTKLKNIDFGGNLISNEALDLTKFPLLQSIYLEGNSIIQKIDLRNANNTKITDLNIDDCHQLSCILVDDAAFCAENWPELGCHANYIETDSECDDLKTEIYVPDDNFEKALMDLGYDDFQNDYVSYGRICGVTNLNLNNKKITDLTGIEGFTSLETLFCMNNELKSIEIRKNLSLNALFVQDNKLEKLDVRNGNNENFTYFDALKNPKLRCILVDDADFSTNNWYNIDKKTVFVKDRVECDSYDD